MKKVKKKEPKRQKLYQKNNRYNMNIFMIIKLCVFFNFLKLCVLCIHFKQMLFSIKINVLLIRLSSLHMHILKSSL